MKSRDVFKLSVSLVLLGVLLTLLLGLLLLPYGKQSETPSFLNRNPLKVREGEALQYTQASPQNKLSFPQDHLPHKDYRHEWWYLTANLQSDTGMRFATQWTLFRTADNQAQWYFAHGALADTKVHLASFRQGREELANVTLTEQPFSAVIDDWLWQSTAALLPEKRLSSERLPAQLLPATLSYGAARSDDEGWQVKLSLATASPFFLQGEQGYSKKHQNEAIASHYYSQPFIDVKGEILWQGQWLNVTGSAWFDREWGSAMLAQDQQGWDWFSLRLSTDKALMIYRIRSSEQDFVYGSLMYRDGRIEILDANDIKLVSHVSDTVDYPYAFDLQVEKKSIGLNVDVRVAVVNQQQIMRFGIEYFEGMVTFKGSHAGEGFVEMTGYVN
ncbi:carotenoid 1,2-hydratase [Moritella marina ATCC 15381]|uniref:Carotenoid 1,2-hydratase n=1 Tax=Moritella marina ATCC 15381 TaxID=1202962 RepID=A0A5J6WL57_MORMI|nr:lipocalin-like domain-containing protein [Moritella marina]QFI38008.1 carotenoid 1,2-hydratase [Moritella marina ATCC 15381]